MKERVMIIGAAMVLIAANLVQAEVCRIVNGSFEKDGWITDITAKEPNGWDVSVPTGKFGGYVKKEWSDPNFNLTLYSMRYATFDVNDMTTVSQQVSLTGVDKITFDLKLATYPSIYPWDPDKCTAVVLIDGSAVWESNSVGTDVRDEYFDQFFTVANEYKDGLPHLLSFGLRVNVNENLRTSYITHWDSIECTVICGGGGFLVGDFNRDCYVDVNDLKLLTELWLDEVEPNDRCNLFGGDDLPGGFINFSDFAFFTDSWNGDMSRLKTFTEKWLQVVPNDDLDNLFHDDDAKPSGVINFFDFAIFADTWLGSSYIEEAP